MKRVSFEVAKAIKEAGYPQYEVKITEIGWYNQAGIYTKELPFLWEGDDVFVAIAPTYIHVWLWLWREKKIYLDIDSKVDRIATVTVRINDLVFTTIQKCDPEVALKESIEYLVEHNLIK